MARIEIDPVEENSGRFTQFYMSRDDVGRINNLVDKLNEVLSAYPDNSRIEELIGKMNNVLLAMHEMDKKRFERMLEDLNRIVLLVQRQAEISSPEFMEKIVNGLEIIAASMDKNVYAEFKKMESALAANSEAVMLKMDELMEKIENPRDIEAINENVERIAYYIKNQGISKDDKTLVRDVEAVNENLNRLISQLKQQPNIGKQIKSINKQLTVLYDFEHMLKVITEKKLAVSRIKPKSMPAWSVARMDKVADEVHDVINTLVDIMIAKHLSSVEYATQSQVADAINHNYRHTKTRLDALAGKNRIKTRKKGKTTIYFL